ncbi:MAG: YigZ family protein [Bacteroidota bacterium]|nr:YigZ family protein [Bacteroidota bacterium]
MVDSYLTLEKITEGLYKEKGSKFFSFAMPVSTEHEIKEILDSYKKKYYDSRHICYAYILGKDKETYKANDGGEPNHSAGDPILGQIRSKNLTDCLIIVVRYFGGTKLGVSGLVNAYKTAAADAIHNNIIIEKVVKEQVVVNFPYHSLNEVMRVVKDYNLDIVQQNFDINCQMLLLVRQQQLDEVSAIFENMTDVQFGMNA